jgi:predicted dehydrogenase
MNSRHISRREFISSAAAVSAFTIVPRHVLGGTGYVAPSEKLNIAGIGVGGMGFSNIRSCGTENISALCDVDSGYAAKAFDAFPNAKRYVDFREMLEKETALDAVIIATPDHTHAVIAMATIKAGKHIYCQKPLAHNVHETRILAQAAKESNVVTQMGIQGHSGEGINQICEWIWDGAIGNVEKVDAWCSLGYFPPGQAGWCTTHYDIPKDKPQVPDGLDWDLWLGPAPVRDYHPTYHPAKWRAWYDFGNGMMGDRGVHTLDSVFMALKLKQPEVISATASNLNDQTHPICSIVQFSFAGRQNMPPVELTWYEGLEVPRPKELEDGRKLPHEGGVLFKGSKGTIMCGVYGDSPRIIPETKMKAYTPPPKTLRRVTGSHEQEWINAIKEGRKANACFEYSGPLTEFTMLGSAAKRMRSKLYYDSEKMEFKNNPEATKLLTRQYRQGWILERVK